MITHRFLFDDGVPEMHLKTCRRVAMPGELPVYHSGRSICTALLDDQAYTCDIPVHLRHKLDTGELDYVFVFEPPLTDTTQPRTKRRELVSILLVLKTETRPKA